MNEDGMKEVPMKAPVSPSYRNTLPLFWLATFARHHRVAYRGDWLRALRRGAWVAVVAAVFVALRLQGAFQLPIALFVLTMVLIAETTLSVER